VAGAVAGSASLDEEIEMAMERRISEPLWTPTERMSRVPWNFGGGR
jgi:hypothetical protein